MKVFRFDPATGKRGELVEEIRRPSTFAQSLEFAHSQGKQAHLQYKKPADTNDSVWSSHLYMGRDNNKGEFVPSKYDFWVCCCQGNCNGQKTPTGMAWVWNIIPPYNLLEKNKEAA